MSKVKMNLFAQLLQLVERNTFDKLLKRHKADKHNKGFNRWPHFVTMLFMHFSGVTSLRGISNGLRSATGNLNHFGVVKPPTKSTLSYQNKKRGFEVFQDLYFALLDKYEPSLVRRRQYARRLRLKVFIMDASVIPLSLLLFDWAKFRTKRGAIKLHAVLNCDTSLFSYACITDGKHHDVTTAK